MNLNFKLVNSNWSEVSELKTDLLVFLASNEDTENISQKELTSFVDYLANCEVKDWQPNKNESLYIYSSKNILAQQLLLLGVGDGSLKEIDKSLKTLDTYLNLKSVKNVAICLSGLNNQKEIIKNIIPSLNSITYKYSTTKKTEKIENQKDFNINLLISEKCENEFNIGLALAKGQRLTQELGNLPPNYATPTFLAQTALDLVNEKNEKLFKVKVLDKKEIEKLKMGAFLGIAQGSEEEPKFIELDYQGGKKTDNPIVLVGKGITFDSGGISIKPAAGMDEMKFDMCGAASVLGVFQTLVELKPKINVVGLIATCENLPSGKALKPGDVVTSMSGQTIEILNTDAEGRLILCDALTYAQKNFTAKTIIDIATLTGACVIALGKTRTGMYATTDELANELIKAGEETLDLCWRMPLDEEYFESLESNFADFSNSGSREGGSIVGAKFLQKFIEDKNLSWSHLDIAGTAWNQGKNKGATGRPVKLLVQYLLNQIK